MSLESTLPILALLVCSFAVFRYFGGQIRSCLFCGTRTGEHDSSCPWHSED